jgi:hypothetical protein
VTEDTVAFGLSQYHHLMADAAQTFSRVSAASARPYATAAREVAGLLTLHGRELYPVRREDWAPTVYGNRENLIAEADAIQQRFNVAGHFFKTTLTSEDPRVMNLLTPTLREDMEYLDDRWSKHGMRTRQLARRARVVQLHATVTPEYAAGFGDEKVNAKAVKSAQALAAAGVPVEYAQAVCPVYQLNGSVAQAIIAAHHEGIAPEYVRATL